MGGHRGAYRVLRRVGHGSAIRRRADVSGSAWHVPGRWRHVPRAADDASGLLRARPALLASSCVSPGVSSRCGQASFEREVGGIICSLNYFHMSTRHFLIKRATSIASPAQAKLAYASVAWSPEEKRVFFPISAVPTGPTESSGLPR